MNAITDIIIISSLEKIYDSDLFPEEAYGSFSMLKNEKKSFQIVIDMNAPGHFDFIINCNSDYKIYKVENIKSDFPMNPSGCDDYYKFSQSGYYPDLLVPIDKKVVLDKGINVLWVEVSSKDAGEYRFEFISEGKSAKIEYEIIDAELDFNRFIYTNWIHTDCLMSHYNFEVFSDEYWRVCENFLKTACEYGMNCVLTPVFTPPLDTQKGCERPTVQLVEVTVNDGKYGFNFDKLTQWIEMCERCGIEYFEISHLFTQWGAEFAPKIMATVDGEYKRIFGWETKSSSKKYKKFLTAFSTEFKKYVESRNMKDRVFIHVSDEPNMSVLFSYKKASKIIHKLFEGYKIIDALSDFRFYKRKIVTNPIPSNDHIEKFIGKVPDLWTYYCSAQNKKCVSNRFFCNDSLRNRVIGYQFYKFDIKGFLHWGYNFYYTQLSKEKIDPFTVTDAGKKFPSGDSFIVYPSKDGTPYQSLRLKVFFDALQDMAALYTLEKMTNKQECLNIIENNGIINLTFENYPHDNDWLLSTREEINQKIKANL